MGFGASVKTLAQPWVYFLSLKTEYKSNEAELADACQDLALMTCNLEPLFVRFKTEQPGLEIFGGRCIRVNFKGVLHPVQNVKSWLRCSP
jgi:hypothetical protein